MGYTLRGVVFMQVFRGVLPVFLCVVVQRTLFDGLIRALGLATVGSEDDESKSSRIVSRCESERKTDRTLPPSRRDSHVYAIPEIS